MLNAGTRSIASSDTGKTFPGGISDPDDDDHRHVHNADYNHLRSRSWYLAKGLQKHGLNRFVLTADAPDDAFTLTPQDGDSQGEEEPA